MSRRFRNVRPQHNTRSKPMHLVDCQTALSFRATSVSTDEGLCLANLLGLDASLVVRCEPQDRMKVIWKSILANDLFPSLFWPCDRMEEEKFRWAPKSVMYRRIIDSTLALSVSRPPLMSIPSEMFGIAFQPSPIMKLEEDGFSFMQDAIILSGIKRPIETQLFYQQGSSWYEVMASADRRGEYIRGSVFSGPSGRMIPASERFVLLFAKSPNSSHMALGHSTPAIFCALMSNTESHDVVGHDHGHSHPRNQVEMWCTATVRRVDQQTVDASLNWALPSEELWQTLWELERGSPTEGRVQWNAFPPWGRVRPGIETVTIGGAEIDLDGVVAEIETMFEDGSSLRLCMADPSHPDTIVSILPQKLLTATMVPANCVWVVD
ncbi:hypothetical protein BP6252_13212 [Coleophoma cylindrospora]|uniref:Uncharacterized protein n=1 Tax=Coleophoma cylindrospora TaxID=1849047 RepID=A0A3D8QA88_9HELO|nr:hypothetical protein BP6252_13212 [Coleophoma cylindrospora]